MTGDIGYPGYFLHYQKLCNCVSKQIRSELPPPKTLVSDAERDHIQELTGEKVPIRVMSVPKFGGSGNSLWMLKYSWYQGG